MRIFKAICRYGIFKVGMSMSLQLVNRRQEYWHKGDSAFVLYLYHSPSYFRRLIFLKSWFVCAIVIWICDETSRILFDFSYALQFDFHNWLIVIRSLWSSWLIACIFRLATSSVLESVNDLFVVFSPLLSQLRRMIIIGFRKIVPYVMSWRRFLAASSRISDSNWKDLYWRFIWVMRVGQNFVLLFHLVLVL